MSQIGRGQFPTSDIIATEDAQEMSRKMSPDKTNPTLLELPDLPTLALLNRTANDPVASKAPATTIPPADHARVRAEWILSEQTPV